MIYIIWILDQLALVISGQIKCVLMNRHGREEAIAQLIVAGKSCH